MVTTYNWIAVAELVSKTTGKFLVGANYDSFFSIDNQEDMSTWDKFVECVRGLYSNDSKFFDITAAIINDELICFETEKEAKDFYSACLKTFGSSSLIPFIYLVSPTEGYLTDTN